MEPGIRTNGQGNVSVCPIVWVILQKKFLYLHQYITSLSGCLGYFTEKVFYIYISIVLLCLVVWVFMQKKILYYIISMCYIYRRNGMKNLCLIVWVFMKKKLLYYFISICYIYRRNGMNYIRDI